MISSSVSHSAEQQQQHYKKFSSADLVNPDMNSSESSENATDAGNRQQAHLPQDVRDRGRRMMGVLMGTLSKFKSEESDKSEATLKRILLEQKLAGKLQKERELLEAQISTAQAEIQNRLPVEIAQVRAGTEECCSGFYKTETFPVLYWKPNTNANNHP